MKCIASIVVTVSCTFVLSLSAHGADKTLEDYKTVFEREIAKIRAEDRASREAALSSYGKDLAVARRAVQKEGDLEGTMAAQREIERFAKEKTVPKDTSDRLPSALTVSRKKYHDALLAAELRKSKNTVDLIKRYLVPLEGLKKRLVQQGKIDEAQQVATEIEKVTFVLADVESRMPVEKQPAAKPAEVPRASLTASLRKGLVLHYSFDRNEGEKVSDKSGNSNDGKAHEAKWIVRGKRDGAYEFDGNGDYIEASDGKMANFGRTDPFTLSAWVRLQPKTARDRNQFLVTKTGLIERAYRGYYMLVLADLGDVPALCLQFDGRRYTAVAGSTDVIDREWHHVVAVSLGKDGSASDLRLYVDGKKETVRPVHDALGSNSIETPHAVRVGARHDTPVEAKGTIDEVMIFNRALSWGEIRQLYDSQR